MSKSTQTTFTRLADGSWGIRTPKNLMVGESVTVSKKYGNGKEIIVKTRISADRGVYVWSIDEVSR